MDDPFYRHPELRPHITALADSYFADFHPRDADERVAEQGFGPEWRYTDEERERRRHSFFAPIFALEPRPDIWVFAYGSLMWDPAMDFAEVRHGNLPGYARRMILRDTLGGRGTVEAPGLMAALDVAPERNCDGLVYRLAAHRLEEETDRLWRREVICPGYHPTWVQVQTTQGDVTALTFVADHEADMIAHDLSREDQIRFISTGQGFLGSSRDYLENMLVHFRALDIQDADLLALSKAVARWPAP